ncbi:beta-N-acetylhexosaminidase [Prevotella sp. oral taxon 376]|uniref:glycoside hydrolase family 20 protein n=1 Tax=Prevotella sp. oral taxon 376 TaxID=712466 RepID=UPI000D1E8F67|nr:family 20 glycosylhydrolase [Prevotella sp. oral taxon 376]PTL34411.1 beta-N-acetylhexosaminidase [Prevotella sp. oral taxon 376]
MRIPITLCLMLCLSVSPTEARIPQKKAIPSYQWRGLMIDVSRHFFSLDFLRKQIDLCSRYHINKLHLHLTDNGGWRLEIHQYPELTQIGAWRSEEDWGKWWIDGQRDYTHQGAPGAYGGYYTQEEMRQLVKYAARKGIEIIPEIEMPGHSDEVLATYPELGCVDETTGKVNLSSDLCPSNPATFTFLTNVLREVMRIFPSQYIHIGGDEAEMNAWKSCRNCQSYMHAHHIKEVSGLQTLLIDRIDSFLTANGRSLIGWDELCTLSPAPSSIKGNPKTIMVWRDSKYARLAIQQGFNVIMAPNRYCYINNLQDAPELRVSERTNYLPLKQVYSFNPIQGLTPAEASHVLGIEAAVWTEQIETPQEAERAIFPRLLAIAKIGMESKPKPYKEFRDYALKEVDKLRAEGVNAFDLSKEKGDRPESLLPVSHLATTAKATYNKPYSPRYEAQGTATLTDGQRGGWTHADQRWQGFIGSDGYCMDITLDLGEEQRFESVQMDFIQNAGAWIFLPEELVISVSDDGGSFKQIYRSHQEKITKRYLNFVCLGYQGSPQKARYIRIQAKSQGQGDWVFTDEIIVR